MHLTFSSSKRHFSVEGVVLEILNYSSVIVQSQQMKNYYAFINGKSVADFCIYYPIDNPPSLVFFTNPKVFIMNSIQVTCQHFRL